MVEAVSRRRASYGPASPNIGERGARTRQQIVDVTLSLFAERGVHATLVDDIAKVVGVSRATLYQYFESKEQIFLELVQESGGELLRALRRLGALGPTAEGFDNLHWWLAEWSDVYDKYSTVFAQWASVDSPKGPLRPMLARWLDAYASRLSARLEDAAVAGADPGDLAMAVWAIVERFGYYRHSRPSSLGLDAATDDLATVVQLILFPDTPAAALALRVRPQPHVSNAPTGNGASRFEPNDRWLPETGRFGELSPRTLRTVRRLLDAGGRLFAETGYHEVSVDRIVAAAGLSRGTFYKYFDDKLDLLVTLSKECAERNREMSARLSRLGTGPEAGVQLRAWLGEYVALHARHAGVFRVWLDQVLPRPELEESGAVAFDSALAAITTMLEGVDRLYPLDLDAASLMLLGLLERFPDQAVGTRYERSPDEVVTAMAAVMERGFLNPGTSQRRRDPDAHG